MTPVTQKLNAARKKNFVRYVVALNHHVAFLSILKRGAAKPTQLFAQPDGSSDDDEADEVQPATNPKEIPQVDDENPF